jgi:hypothetical protein
MVHKVFASDDGNELSIYINHKNDLYLRIENKQDKKEQFIILNLKDATELHTELGKLIDTINEKNREPF